MEIPTPSYQNSAGRLLSAMDHLDSIGKGKQYLDVIPEWVGGEQSGDTHKKSEQVEIGLGQLRVLYTSVLQDIEYSDMPEAQCEVIINGLPELRKALYPPAFNNVIPPFDAGEKALIHIAAVNLSSENSVSEDEIKAIKDSIDQLYDVIKNSSIQKSAWKLLLDLVRVTEESLHWYDIHGARALKSAFKQMLAEMTEFYFSDDDTDELSNSSFWKTAMRHLALVDKVAAKALQYRALIEHAGPMLLGGE